MSKAEIKLHNLHKSQQIIVDESTRFNVLKCGRRFGKTDLSKELIINPMLDGFPVGYFAPIYKDVEKVWDEVKFTLKDVTSRKDEQLKSLKLITGGELELWTMEDPDAGRGRKYKRVVFDECEKARHFKKVWQESVRGTLADFKGDAWFLSTPKFGQTYFKEIFHYKNTKKDWNSWSFTSYDNPFLPEGEIDEIKALLPDIIFRCEYLAEDVDLKEGLWAFEFKREKHLGKPALNENYPVRLSFDFNRNPICCLVSQQIEGQDRHLELIKLNNSNIYELCDTINIRYGGSYFMVTGDASGTNSSAMVKDNINYYVIIMDKLGLSEGQLFIPSVNPGLADNQVLVNSLLYKGNVVIHEEKCKQLIFDLENVQMLADGSIKKQNREDPTQQADALDCFRYYCNIFRSDFLSRIKEISNIADKSEDDEKFSFPAL